MKKVSILLAAICFIGTTAFVNAQTKEAKITFTEESFDFGSIAEEKGPVTKEFTFTNTGAAPLIVQNVKASCGCTTPEWTKDPVLPGKKGIIKATYNPQNRPGQFNKTITVTSNAENNTVILTIKGEVKPKPVTLEDTYPMQMGGLRLKTNHIAFIKVFTTEVKTDSVQIINTSTEDIKMTFDKIPAHIKIKVVPETLKPNAKGVIVATYDGSKQTDWGFIMDRVDLILNGKPDANNKISISATIDEDFSKLTPEQRANAPKANFETKEFNFNTIKEGESASFEYKLTNDGKSDLIIRKVKASCGCTAVTPSETVIKPGKSTTIKTTFNSAGKPGKQNKTINVITNDPDNSNITLRISGDVEKVEQTPPNK
ncbi:MAG: DUF1573 domain-containing protein [Bacteroidia bacterium]|nr:DUF1573 domain-containing protein [Bacteroidia bacterium]